MNLEILEDIQKLRDSIKKDNVYLELQIANEALENSDEAKILSYKKDVAIFNYGDALKIYKMNSVEALQKEKEMSKAIYNLNQNEIVKEYNKKYKEYLLVLAKINKEIFGIIK